MGLIDFNDIDDRDTFISQIFGCGPISAIEDKFKVWQTMIKNELPPDTIVSNLSGGRFKIDLSVIACTGASVETIFNIPFMHQLLKMEIKHTDSANADSGDALDYSVSHAHHPSLQILLLSISATTASDIVDEYEDYYMSRGEYRLLSDSTNTDLLHVSFYIRIVGE